VSAAVALLDRLVRLGVAAHADGSTLHLRPASSIPANLLAELTAQKANVLALLTEPANDRPPGSASPPLPSPLPSPLPGCSLMCGMCCAAATRWRATR
jgi:hypothetical protein